jgi:hypothetical protein
MNNILCEDVDGLDFEEIKRLQAAGEVKPRHNRAVLGY